MVPSTLQCKNNPYTYTKKLHYLALSIFQVLDTYELTLATPLTERGNWESCEVKGIGPGVISSRPRSESEAGLKQRLD